MPPTASFPKRLAIGSIQFDQLRVLLSTIVGKNSFYTAKFQAAHAGYSVRHLGDLSDSFPFTTKAEIIADRINEALAAPFDVGGTEISVSASIGITLGAADDSPDELLGKADAAMYTAKARDQSRSTNVDGEQKRPNTTADA